jgi:hypothetical protein
MQEQAAPSRMSVLAASPAATQAIANFFAQQLHAADCYLLYGSVGAGKSYFRCVRRPDTCLPLPAPLELFTATVRCRLAVEHSFALLLTTMSCRCHHPRSCCKISTTNTLVSAALPWCCCCHGISASPFASTLVQLCLQLTHISCLPYLACRPAHPPL